MTGRRQKPRFAEAMTLVRHANTVIKRLSSYSGLHALPDDVPGDPGERAEATIIRDLGFDPIPLPGVRASGEGTDPAVEITEREAPSPPEEREADGAALPAPPHPTLQSIIGSVPEMPATTPAMEAEVPAVARAQPASDPAVDAAAAHGEVIVVFGCRGGAGATTIGVNLAAELGRGARGAVIVDLDLQMGDVLCALDLTPSATLAELLADIDTLDMASLRRRLTAHRSGVFAISQGDRFDQLEQLRPERIPALIAGLSRQFGAVVIDGLRDFSDLAISALDMADRIVLVVPEDVTGVKNASRCLEVFRRLGYGDTKIALVVNRHDARSKVTPAAIGETLRLQPMAVLPTDARAASDALDEGLLVRELAPASRLCAAIDQLGAALVEGHVPAAARGTGLLDRLRAIFGGPR